MTTLVSPGEQLYAAYKRLFLTGEVNKLWEEEKKKPETVRKAKKDLYKAVLETKMDHYKKWMAEQKAIIKEEYSQKTVMEHSSNGKTFKVKEFKGEPSSLSIFNADGTKKTYRVKEEKEKPPKDPSVKSTKPQSVWIAWNATEEAKKLRADKKPCGAASPEYQKFRDEFNAKRKQEKELAAGVSQMKV